MSRDYASDDAGTGRRLARFAVAGNQWRAIAVIALGMALAGCGLMPQVEPVPPGLGADEDIEPIGPVVEIGRGQSIVNGPWRYQVYESRMGTCTRISFEQRGGDGPLGCGGTPAVEPPGADVSLMSYGSSSDSGWNVEGMASDDVVEIWIELQDGGRVAAVPLMSLGPVDLPGQIFYVETPIDQVPVRVVALDAQGKSLGEASIDR